MLSEEKGHVGKRIVSVSDSGPALERLTDDLLRICRASQLQQDCSEHAVCGKAHGLPGHRTLSECQGLLDAPCTHQTVGFDIRWG